MDIEGLPETIEDLTVGDTECPCVDCDIVASEIKIIEHFECGHNLYDQKHAMCKFIDTDEFREYHGVERNPSKLFHHEGFDELVRKGIENHPIFNVDMYKTYFGSIKIAVDNAIHGVENVEYETSNEYFEKREKIRNRNTILEKSHKLYGSNWGQIRWDIYQRDNEQCRVTGETDENFVGNLNVHHIKPAREFVDEDGNVDRDAMNDPSNLITLSSEIHGRLEGKFTDCDPDEFARRAREELSIEA